MDNNLRLSLFAKDLRNNPTPFEVILWKYLKSSQLGGYKFRRQSIIGPYICDFLCPSKGLVIEVDGDTHGREQDKRRDDKLARLGFVTMRFSNYEVGQCTEAVLDMILAKLNSLPDRWPGELLPHPNPVLESRASKTPKGDGL